MTTLPATRTLAALSVALVLCATVTSGLFAQQRDGVAVTPQPVSVRKTSGEFRLEDRLILGVPAGDAAKPVVVYLQNRLETATGFSVTAAPDNPAAAIHLVLRESPDATLGREGYQLSVTPEAVLLRANEPAGLFYGVQTLLQLLPAAVESPAVVRNVGWTIPCVEITDYPRFGWRGLLLDVSRHFFTKQEVKGFIDQMAKYKFNLLHLHLTDDEGWRIEIKSLPELTKVGAWSVGRVGYFGTFPPPAPDEPRDYGGFYTQDDLREIVRYAQDRFVDILPEIDVPGHSLAAVAAYPDLSCTPGAAGYRVRSGEKIMEWPEDPHDPPTALVDDTLCPANEKSYEFLDRVLAEVAAIFPFEYIHLGGDECPKNFWEKSAAIKALMAREGLKDMDQVQSYFEKRCERIVESKGKKFMGWNEILKGGLAPNAAVMSWQGAKGGQEAARQRHPVVMSPIAFTYLDHAQGDFAVEPHVYASLRLQKTYAFEPVPTGTDARYVKGGQANVWTEQIYNTRHLQYMVWPRALATAECVWSPPEKKDWHDFVDRVEGQFPRFDAAAVKYAPSLYDPAVAVERTSDDRLKITLTAEANGLAIYYSFDNSFPDRFYPRYTAPLVAPREAVTLKVITYRGDKPMGRMVSLPLAELEKRTEEEKKKTGKPPLEE